MTVRILHGDCRDVLKTLPDGSVHSVITDPPYGLGFMGKNWDHGVPSAEIWRECLRVLKPGSHLLAFAGTRTQHRMACAIEDAGFEIRDMIAWVYGSGFPKSRNLDDEWEGWGTALKPALEPITVARKPLIGTAAENVLEHSAGALNIDGCRVEGAGNTTKIRVRGERPRDQYRTGTTVGGSVPTDVGRWPANLIHDGSDDVLAAFPDAPGQQRAAGPQHGARKTVNCYGDYGPRPLALPRADDAKSAARFFYCAKASRAERGDGNNHPTVKPLALMQYLCRLVTAPGGVVLDPFMGSGSTGVAALREGFDFIGIEAELEYVEIATARVHRDAGLFGDVA